MVALYVCPLTNICLFSYHYMRVLIPLYTCPHASIFVSLYLYVCGKSISLVRPARLYVQGMLAVLKSKEHELVLCV
jgi:hypothetical protein